MAGSHQVTSANGSFRLVRGSVALPVSERPGMAEDMGAEPRGPETGAESGAERAWGLRATSVRFGLLAAVDGRNPLRHL